MGNWRRRYVYLLVNSFDRSTYPLRRINVSSLFSSSNNSTKPEEARLPSPVISFTPPRSKYGNGSLDFFSMFGRGKNKSLIAGADQNGSTFLFDLDQRAIHKQVCLNEPKERNAISVAAGDALYVMDKMPLPGSFEALRYDVPLSTSRDWGWYRLQPPPYVLAPGYTPTAITACAVVNGTDIWVSSPGIGTYSFDTLANFDSWSKSGDWELPFRGRADYFPEYGLWLGFSSRDGMLCSSDLRAATTRSGPQLVHEDWKDVQAQEDWILLRSFLVHLGYGKFCVAKFFQTRTVLTGLCQMEDFAVLTGLTLQQCGVDGELRMIRHRSQLYYFQCTTKGWVF